MASSGDILKRYSLEGFLRRHAFTPKALSTTDLELGCRRFEDLEPRDSMYRVSTFLVREWWNEPARLVEALSVLLLVWNSNFYRFGGGGFNEQMLENCLRTNQESINTFRDRDISSLNEADHVNIQRLFIALSEALKRTSDGVESPVSAGKTLHLLAPNFFPLWDQYIAPAYQCPYQNEVACVAYIAFSQRIRDLIAPLKLELAGQQSTQKEWLSKKTLLKRIDEYNYVTFTLPSLAQLRNKRKAKGAEAG